jgi:hypothetical protein
MNKDKVALLVFSQKTVPPAFLKNVGIVCEGIVDVAFVTNPRDEMLKQFQIKTLPQILVVYDQPEAMRPDNAPKDGILLGQAIYEKSNMGEFSFENVMRCTFHHNPYTPNPAR